MDRLNHDLEERLAAWADQGLTRRLRTLRSAQGPHVRINDQPLLNFSSNDYLGLAHHPAINEAATRAIADYGTGSGSSRLLCGTLQPHQELEERLAQFKQAEGALVFASGYAAAFGTIDALMEKGDIIIIDRLAHACIVDAARACKAKLRVFAHNDLDALQHILAWADQQPPWTGSKRAPRKLIVTESVFSMDGDIAPLREIVELKNRHGAWLMLDEAHATGLFGQHRRGLAEAFELEDQVEIQMGTLGKALGSSGGYICGSRLLIEFLVNRARTFMFSTAPPPANSAAACAALDIVMAHEGETRRSNLWARVDELKNSLIADRWILPPVRSAIVPLIIGDETGAVTMSEQLLQSGVYVPAVRYPSVARGTARLRLTVSAAHHSVDIAALLGALAIARSRREHPRHS